MFFSYILSLLGTWNKNMFSEVIQFFFFFNLPWRKSCKIWWKKSPPHEKGGKQLYDLSQQIYFTWEKKKQLYWKQMLTLCQLLKMERVHSNHCSYKGYWWQLESVMNLLCSWHDSRNYGTKMKSAYQFYWIGP